MGHDIYCDLAKSTSLGGSSSFRCSDLEHCLDVTFPGKVRIGELYVTGTGFIEHRVDWYVGDPLIELNSGVEGANTYDIGWIANRGTSTNVANIWHEGNSRFAFVSTDSSSAGDNVSILNYKDLQVATLYSTYVSADTVSGVTGLFDFVSADTLSADTLSAATGTFSDSVSGTTGFFERVGIGTSSPSFSLEVQRTGVENYVPSSTTRSMPSGIFAYFNNQPPFAGPGEAGFALIAFKDRPTSSVWYIGDAGSQNEGHLAPSFSGPFVIGNRRAEGESLGSAYSENLRIDMHGNVGIGVSGDILEDRVGPERGLAVSGTISGATGLFDYISGATISGVTGTFDYISGAAGVFDEMVLPDPLTGATISGLTGLFDYISGAIGVFDEMVLPDPLTGATVSGLTGLFDYISGATGVFDEMVLPDPLTGATISGLTGLFDYISGATISGVTGIFDYISGGSGTFTGSVSGATVTGDSVFATHIQQQLVDSGAPSSDDVLKWNGTKWISDTVSSAGAATQSNLDNTYVMDQSTRKTDDVRFNTISGNSGHFTGALAVGPYVPSGTVGSIVASNDVISSYTSDDRLKDNITPIPDSLTKISQIAGVEFDWNEKAYSHLEGHDVGVIAQQLEEVLPEAVSTRDDGYKAVKYEKIIPLLIEGLKEQEKRITLLEEKIKS